MGMAGRLARLVTALPVARPADCPGPPAILVDIGGAAPAGPRCRRCGGVHVVEVAEVVVPAGGGPAAEG